MNHVVKLSALLLFISSHAFCQSQEIKAILDEAPNPFSIIVGGGLSFTGTSLWETPVINQTDYTVQLERAGRMRPNISIGIIYTWINDNSDAQKNSLGLIEIKPHGWSTALFINPIKFDELSNSSGNLQVDLGLGVGYRWNQFSILATAEFFAVKQPRQYFIDQYQGNNAQYIVANEIQTSIDGDNSSIFKSTIAWSVGLKLCYTFDVVKKLYTDDGKEAVL